MWACTAQWARVLKPSGPLFVLLGDKHHGAPGGALQAGACRIGCAYDRKRGRTQYAPKRHKVTTSVPPESLFAMPWRYTIGCVDQLGLVHRAEMIWHKPNPIPESVADRAVRAHKTVCLEDAVAEFFGHPAQDEVVKGRAPTLGQRAASAVAPFTQFGCGIGDVAPSAGIRQFHDMQVVLDCDGHVVGARGVVFQYRLGTYQRCGIDGAVRLLHRCPDLARRRQDVVRTGACRPTAQPFQHRIRGRPFACRIVQTIRSADHTAHMVKAYDAGVSTKMWHWYSMDHALAATLFSHKCGELEKNPREEQRDEHRAYAGASILASVAFMEASINELLASASHPNLELGGARGELPQDEREALTALRKAWGDRGPSTPDRVQLVLHLLRRQPFDAGASPFQNVPQVVSLRNALVHYSPEWQIGVGAPEEDAVKGIAKKLEGKFSENPFFPKGNAFFPDRCLGHGCTVWAWRITFALMEEFFRRVGVTPVYGQVRDQLKL